MRRRQSIGFFGGAFVVVVLLSVVYQVSYNRALNQFREEVRVLEETMAVEEANAPRPVIITTEGAARGDEGFSLQELNGFVVVFLRDRMTIYEYTSIKVDLLPEELQEEIRKGKIVETPEELYGFLENYTS